ncbi:hypothetical protein [Xenorhabdus lircayensis]|uniref:Type III secretion system effector and immunogenic protein OspC2 n=1 Tax=Xenorhabdus lircayensis TaxID=2763499 RepID=A0ABS0U5R7_9GAMM|nr:hypothetical protein [Xenorhabdus lircayensis]MBI6548303.1 hypothetical protein [Xenorhabdus lircayensis]
MNQNEKRALELQRKYWDKYREEVRRRWNERAVDRMMEQGSASRMYGFQVNIHDRMRKNIGKLVEEVGQLSNEEKQFADVFMKKDFFIVHASDAHLTDNAERNLVIYSRVCLQEKGIEFPSHHSSVLDIGRLGNDDYVFFSLEVGNTLQKPWSLFGKDFYRIAYKKENMALRHSSMVLVDQLQPGPPNSRMIKNISKRAHDCLKLRVFMEYSICFSGIDDCLRGLLYSIILEIRNLTRSLEGDAKVLLSARSDDEINRIINGLFRPEVRVPRMIGITRGDYQTIMWRKN